MSGPLREAGTDRKGPRAPAGGRPRSGPNRSGSSRTGAPGSARGPCRSLRARRRPRARRGRATTARRPRLNRPGRSGATRIRAEPSQVTSRLPPAAPGARGQERRRPFGVTGRPPSCTIVQSTRLGDQPGLPRAPRRRPGGAGPRSASSSSRVVRSPTTEPASIVAGSSRSRRVATSGRSRWWRTSARGVDVLGGQAEARPDAGDEVHPDLGVVAGPALADVVQLARPARAGPGRDTRSVRPPRWPARPRTGAGRR